MLAVAEHLLLVLSLSLLGAVAANFSVAFLAEQFQIVSKPYDPAGMLFGMVTMTAAGTIALLTKRPGIVMTFTVAIFVWFFYWSGQSWNMVLKMTPFAVLLPGITIYGAWIGLKSLRR